MKKRQPKKQFKLIDGHRTRICDYMNCRQNALHTIKIKKGVKIFRCDKHNMVMTVWKGLPDIPQNYYEVTGLHPTGITVSAPERKTFWQKVKEWIIEY